MKISHTSIELATAWRFCRRSSEDWRCAMNHLRASLVRPPAGLACPIRRLMTCQFPNETSPRYRSRMGLTTKPTTARAAWFRAVAIKFSDAFLVRLPSEKIRNLTRVTRLAAI